jgi:hypothetical protein
MSYDINSIRKTTDKGIPDLADKIFAGIVNEEEAINAIFMGLRPKLTKELQKRKDDEILWIAAAESMELQKLKDYVETYDNEAPEYIGRHIDEAYSLITLIEKDDKEWYDARSKDSISAYRHYIDIYDNPAPSYRGKYVELAKQKIGELLPPTPNPRIDDDEAWNNAIKVNTIESYKEYLHKYANPQNAYKGIHVKVAKQALFRLQDEFDWNVAKSEHTIESYQHYVSIYSTLSEFVGQHIDEARRAIKELTLPDPRIEDDNAWEEATRINSIDGYRYYLSLYKNHANEAELAIRHLIDEKAWKNAKDEGTIPSYENYLSVCKENEYPGYEWAHVNAAKKQIGDLRKVEEQKHRIAEDNAAWEKARQVNTKHSYEEYLAKNRKSGGLHIREAENAILRLQSEEDWRNACAENTFAAYKRFVDKYEHLSNKYMSMYLPQAKKKLGELTPNPSFKWFKLIIVILVFALCCFLWIQRKNDAWPYNKEDIPVEEVDSLQWAIDNHDISLLERYAESDSARAFYPLALCLNENDSVNNIDRTIQWLTKSIIADNDSNAYQLRQSIYVHIQFNTSHDIEVEFQNIDPTLDESEDKYLDLYRRYVLSIDRDCNEFNLGYIRYLNLENKANDYIEYWNKVSDTKESVYGKHCMNEWKRLKRRLDEILWDVDKRS